MTARKISLTSIRTSNMKPSDYLTTADAATTYLTQSAGITAANASATYATKLQVDRMMDPFFLSGM